MSAEEELRRFLVDHWIEVPGTGRPPRHGEVVERFATYALVSYGRKGPFSNWVVPDRRQFARHELDEALAWAEAFFSTRSTAHSWLIFEEHYPWLADQLLERGLVLTEAVDCMVRTIEEGPGVQAPERVRKVETADDLREAMALDDSYDEHSPEQFQTALERNVDRLDKGLELWFLGLEDGKPAASASMHFIPSPPMAYLSGATTAPSYRRRGLYSNLLALRLATALQRGYEVAATHADTATSAPILANQGFVSLARLRVYARAQ